VSILPGFALLGAGGHALSVADAIVSTGRSVSLYYGESLACPQIPQQSYGGEFAKLQPDSGLLALAIGDNNDRQATWRMFQDRVSESQLPPIVHSSAIVSPHARLEPGCVVLAGAYVGPGSCIGLGAIVNTGAIVEHETHVGEFASLAPGAICGGGATIGTRAFLGMNSSVAPKTVVGSGAVVGANSFVKDSLPDGTFAFGSPAKEAKAKFLGVER